MMWFRFALYLLRGLFVVWAVTSLGFLLLRLGGDPAALLFPAGTQANATRVEEGRIDHFRQGRASVDFH